MKLKKPKINWSLSERTRDHMVQAILIFTSVFLAFALNEYRIKRVEKKETQEALQAVIAEIERNMIIIEHYIPYHEELMTNAGLLIESDSLRYMENFEAALLSPNYRGIMRDILTKQAWHYINAENIKFDLKTRMDIIFVYQQQEFVERSINRIVDSMMDRAMFDPKRKEENATLFYIYISDLWGQETAILETYKIVLQNLKNQPLD